MRCNQYSEAFSVLKMNQNLLLTHLMEWAIASHGMYESHLFVIFYYYFIEHDLKGIPLELCLTTNIIPCYQF
jgi:hypothetical protein